MNLAETTTLLKARSGYTSQPYGQQTVMQWHEALVVYDHGDVTRALARAAERTNRIALADVLDELRPTPPRPEAQNTAPARRDCACGVDTDLNRTICADHRRIGLEAIARIRADRATKP